MSVSGNTDRAGGASIRFDPSGSVSVVTGAAGGIGAALVRELARRGAAVVVAVDLEAEHMKAVASVIDGEFEGCRVLGEGLDVSDGDSTRVLVDSIESEHAPVDLWCANAGIGTLGGVETDPATWQRVWEVNVMAHVYAAAALVPRWVERGRGHLLVTASAAGLLTNLGDAPYSVTKHGAVAFAEWVAITHGGSGVGVTCVCPQGVRTPMVFGAEADEFADLHSTPPSQAHEEPDRDDAMAIATVRSLQVLEPAEVAEVAVDALEAGRFLALPHPDVARYEQARAADHDRWILGMRRLQESLSG